MKVTTKQLTNALLSVADEKTGKKLDDSVRSFVEVLAKRGELGRVRDVIRRLTTTVVAETAFPLKPAQRKSIQEVTGTMIEEIVRPELIGGLRLRINDRIIDGTIAGQLEQLKRTLSE